MARARGFAPDGHDALDSRTGTRPLAQDMRAYASAAASSTRRRSGNEYGRRDARGLRATAPRRVGSHSGAPRSGSKRFRDVLAQRRPRPPRSSSGRISRYIARTLRRATGFALTAILIVALGIGATTAAFSVTDFVLLRPAAVSGPERLVKLHERTPGIRPAWNCRQRTIATGQPRAPCSRRIGLSSRRRRQPGRHRGSRCASKARPYPPTCSRRSACSRCSAGCSPRLTIVAAAPGTLLLSYRLWQTHFGGDPSRRRAAGAARRRVASRSLGVMPREFRLSVERRAVLDAGAVQRRGLRGPQRQLALRRRPSARRRDVRAGAAPRWT